MAMFKSVGLLLNLAAAHDTTSAGWFVEVTLPVFGSIAGPWTKPPGSRITLLTFKSFSDSRRLGQKPWSFDIPTKISPTNLWLSFQEIVGTCWNSTPKSVGIPKSNIVPTMSAKEKINTRLSRDEVAHGNHKRTQSIGLRHHTL